MFITKIPFQYCRVHIPRGAETDLEQKKIENQDKIISMTLVELSKATVEIIDLRRLNERKKHSSLLRGVLARQGVKLPAPNVALEKNGK